MDTKHPMVVAAARVLCERGAEQCGVDAEDSWKLYGEDYLADAAAALDAAGAGDLYDFALDAALTRDTYGDEFVTKASATLLRIARAAGAA